MRIVASLLLFLLLSCTSVNVCECAKQGKDLNDKCKALKKDLGLHWDNEIDKCNAK